MKTALDRAKEKLASLEGTNEVEFEIKTQPDLKCNTCYGKGVVELSGFKRECECVAKRKRKIFADKKRKLYLGG